jgi:hypothetical protein
LSGLPFEVQVRSLLEHAWASVDHEVVYKSKVTFSDDVIRRFSSIAGALEMIDRELMSLRTERDIAIENAKTKLQANELIDSALDGGTLAATMEIIQPEGTGWRRIEEGEAPTPFAYLPLLIALLQGVGIGSPRDLHRRLGKRLGLVHTYASLSRLAPERVSHLALVALVIGDLNGEVLRWYLPEIAQDWALQATLAT